MPWNKSAQKFSGGLALHSYPLFPEKQRAARDAVWRINDRNYWLTRPTILCKFLRVFRIFPARIWGNDGRADTLRLLSFKTSKTWQPASQTQTCKMHLLFRSCRFPSAENSDHRALATYSFTYLRASNRTVLNCCKSDSSKSVWLQRVRLTKQLVSTGTNKKATIEDWF